MASFRKVCFYCRREFEAIHPLANICSPDCRLRTYTLRTRRTEPEPADTQPEPADTRPEPGKAEPGPRMGEMTCHRCGKSMQDTSGVRKYCSRTCRKAMSRKARQAMVRRLYVEPVTMTVLRRRDNDTCRLCGQPVDFTKRQPDPRAATIDHVIALTKGGEHSYRNTQLAHYRCNTVKGKG